MRRTICYRYLVWLPKIQANRFISWSGNRIQLKINNDLIRSLNNVEHWDRRISILEINAEKLLILSLERETSDFQTFWLKLLIKNASKMSQIIYVYRIVCCYSMSQHAKSIAASKAETKVIRLFLHIFVSHIRWSVKMSNIFGNFPCSHTNFRESCVIVSS